MALLWSPKVLSAALSMNSGSLRPFQRLPGRFLIHRTFLSATLGLKQTVPLDPFELVRGELEAAIEQVRSEVVSEHPSLAQAVEYYFTVKGKQVRPVLSLLMSRTINHGRPSLSDSGITLRQRSIAPIVEMIHTASLLHEDIMDDPEAKKHRRSNKLPGNKFSVLAGDFLLTRASLLLSRIESHPATESISTGIADLVEGSVLQTKSTLEESISMDHYMARTYLRTASLMAHACSSVAHIENFPKDVIDTSYEFGKQFGLTYQIIEEMLDHTPPSTPFGKAPLTFVNRGIVTAPVLLALEKDSSLKKAIEGNFNTSQDLDMVIETVRKTDSLNDTFKLAKMHHDLALEQLAKLPESPARDGLAALLNFILTRKS